MKRPVLSKSLNATLNDAYLLLDLPGTFWTRYEAVNEAVMKLILVAHTARNAKRRTALISSRGLCKFNGVDAIVINELEMSKRIITRVAV